jgi:hypothetical protein
VIEIIETVSAGIMGVIFIVGLVWFMILALKADEKRWKEKMDVYNRFLALFSEHNDNERIFNNGYDREVKK